jgi:hypothetical protein
MKTLGKGGFVEAAFISSAFLVLSAIQNRYEVVVYKAEVLSTVFNRQNFHRLEN